MTSYNGPGATKRRDLLAGWRNSRAVAGLGRRLGLAELQAWREGRRDDLPLGWALAGGAALMGLVLAGAVAVALIPRPLPRAIAAALMAAFYLAGWAYAGRSINRAWKVTRDAQAEADELKDAARAALRDARHTMERCADLDRLRANFDRLDQLRADLDRLIAERPPNPCADGWAAVFDWQAAQLPRVTDRELSRRLGYSVNTIKASRARLARKKRAS